MKFLVGFLSFICLVSVGEPQCPAWLQDASVPPCPKSGPILSETFPALAHVVSTRAVHETRNGEDGVDFAVSYIETLMKVSGERVPLVFLPVPKEAFEKVKERLSSSKAIPNEGRNKWVNNLVLVPVSTAIHGSDYITYQQDYIKGFYNPTSHKTQIRHMYDRPASGILGPALAKMASELCPDLFETGAPIRLPVEAGPDPLDLPPGFDANTSANYGGNILGVAIGMCLRGSNQTPEVARQYCEMSQEVQVDVNWLWVGHVDEVFATVANPSAKGPCDFALVRASTKRALGILKANPDDLFFSFPPGTRPETQKARLEFPPFKKLCSLVPSPAIGSEAKTHDGGPGPERQRAVQCSEITNKDALLALKSQPETMNYLMAVEAKMKEGETKLLEDFHKRLGCKPKVIEAPALFYGGPLVKGELPAEMGKSIFPNSANLVPLGDHVLSSDPHHKGFRDWMSKAFKELGLNKDQTDEDMFLDTFDQGHRGNGNLHCLTQAFRGCRRPK